MKDDFSVRRIRNQSEYAEWLLKKHYAHRIPSISYAYRIIGGVKVNENPEKYLCDYDDSIFISDGMWRGRGE